MKKFMALYMAPVAEMEKMMANSTPEDTEASMGPWMKWMEAHKKELVDMGAPLGKTKRVTANGISDTKNDIGGYSIVQAESAAAAAKLFEDSPHFVGMPGSWIEVIECMPMPST